MNDEASKPGQEEELAPPASTRWSEDPAPEGDDLAPPYVPGRTHSAGAAAEPVVEDDVDPFPFEEFDIEGDSAGGGADTAAPEVEELEAEAPGVSEPDVSEPEPEPDDPWAESGGADWTPADLAQEEEEATVAQPEEEEVVWSPEDLVTEGPGEAAGPPAPEPALEPEPVTEPEPVESQSEGATAEVAALLDRMARLLREEGPEGVRREMESPDLLTSLLAGLLAGYVSGRS